MQFIGIVIVSVIASAITSGIISKIVTAYYFKNVVDSHVEEISKMTKHFIDDSVIQINNILQKRVQEK